MIDKLKVASLQDWLFSMSMNEQVQVYSNFNLNSNLNLNNAGDVDGVLGMVAESGYKYGKG